MDMYEYFDVTADVGIIARGRTLEELFVNSARAVFNVMANLDKIKPVKEVSFEISSNSIEELILDYLTYLLALKDIHGMLFSEFEVEIDENNFKLRGIARGDEIREEHEIKTEVKAITYHLMEIKKNKLWKVKFVVDV
ncbi:hypothetical protein BMS3Bbin15_00403 [archaeon BMS3Bbin15]|nr:hypothetical protein BMS3Bbin15_00403 [archaeon BMS3Bbin15]